MSRGTSFALSRVEMNIAISERRHPWTPRGGTSGWNFSEDPNGLSSSPAHPQARPPPRAPGPCVSEEAAGSDSYASLISDCSAMTTARYRPTWDLALDPLVSCKLCLGEYPLEQMTTITQCQCIFCTLVGLCRKHLFKRIPGGSLLLSFL